MNLQEEIICLREAVARIEVKLNSFPQCPNPGLCNTLEPRIRALEDADNRRKGGWWSATVIATACATVVAWIITWMKQK